MKVGFESCYDFLLRPLFICISCSAASVLVCFGWLDLYCREEPEGCR